MINSLFLQAEEKVGYIKMPSFYTQFEDNFYQLGCANDVAKEILYLKEEGVQELILDLRDNGGGSIKKAIAPCFFIDHGIFCLQKEKDKLQKNELKFF